MQTPSARWISCLVLAVLIGGLFVSTPLTASDSVEITHFSLGRRIIPARDFVSVTIEVRNNGKKKLDLPVNLKVDDGVHRTGSITLEPGETSRIIRKVPFLEPGRHEISFYGSSQSLRVGASAVSIQSLMRKMVDLERLSLPPSSKAKSAQASSYDRLSRLKNGSRFGWFANDDSGHYLGRITKGGRTEWVMAELDGPGAILRLWSANPKGTLRIYVDGEVRLERSFRKLLSPDKAYPFVHPYAYIAARGYNLYFPIPFSHSAKVTVTCRRPEKLYYHVGYKTYGKARQVDPFTMEQAERALKTTHETTTTLRYPHRSLNPSSRSGVRRFSFLLPPGNTRKFSLDGPAMVQAINIRPRGGDLHHLLRATTISITWDGQDDPSVWAPLGDFFGTIPDFTPYQGLPQGSLPDGTLYSHWPMPFRESAQIRITNTSLEPLQLSGKIRWSHIVWKPFLTYFHAKWRASYPIYTRPKKDWTVLRARGPGRFVGLSLSVANPKYRHWWGEGDEKIYVNGERFPSFFGTGTEDYFGYAWGAPYPFSHPYHNQTMLPGVDNYAHTFNNRFHVLDDVPFTKELQFDLEIWHWRDTKVSYAAVPYWYSSSINQDSLNAPLPPSELIPVYRPPIRYRM